MKKIYPILLAIFVFQITLICSNYAQCNLDVQIESDPPGFLCLWDTVTLTAVPTGGTAPYSYLWETGETTQSIQIILVPGIDYVDVIVTDDNGCTDAAMIKVHSWMDVVSIQWAPTVCEGEELELSVYINQTTPGAIIEWSDGNVGLYNYITQSGTYSVTVTNPGDGCSLSDTADIDVNFVPNPDPQIVGPSILCQGQSATLSITADPNDFILWSTGSQQTTTTINGPGIYTVLVNNSNFCTGYDTLEVASGGALPELDGPPSLCTGQNGSVEVTNAASFTNFNWSTGATTPFISVNGPGTYTVTVADGGGCTATGSFTISAGSSNLSLTGTTTAVTSCASPNGGVNLSVSPTGTYVYNWSNGATNEDLVNIAAGNYTVTVTDNGGCTVSASYTVANDTAPPVPTTTATPETCGQNNGGIDLSVAPTGNYTYLWSNGATSEDLANIGAGTYSVITTSTTTGCTASTSATVTNTTTNPSISGVITQPSSGQNNGAIDITVSPVGSYTYSWSNGMTTEDLSGLGEGTYTVTVSAGGNCTATASFVLVATGCTMTASIAVDAPNPGVVCVGDNITLTASITGGSAPYTYAWSNGMTTPSFTVPAPFNQTVLLTVTDDNGCTALATLHVKVNVWQVDINYSAFPTCQGDTLALVASTTAELPGTVYTWSTGETGFMINVTNSGTYSVSMTHPSVNCTADASVTVAIGTAPAPSPQLIGPNTICAGQSATLTVAGGPFSSYTWSDGSSDPSLTIVGPGNYSVTVTSPEGCTGQDLLDVQGNGASPILNDPAPICQGQSTTVEVLNAPEFTVFEWSNGGTGASINTSLPGIYNVTVTTAEGCTAVGSAEVLQSNTNVSLTGIVTHLNSCTSPNGMVNLTPSPTGTYTFLWSNGASTEDLVNIAAGNYTVTVSEGGNCTASVSFTVADNTILPSLSANVTAAVCGDNMGAIDLTATPSGNYSFSWSNGGSLEDLAQLPPGNYTVTATQTATGCTAVSTFNVPNNSSTFTLSGSTSTVTNCLTPNGVVDLTISPAGTYGIIWSNGQTTEDLQNLNAGTYTVTITEAGACTGEASFQVVSQTAQPVLTQNASPASCGQSNGSVELSVTPTTGNTFLWSNGAIGEDLANLPSGIYSVTVTGSNGCTATASASIPENNIAIDLMGMAVANSSCSAPNGSIDLSVSPAGAYNYVWSNGLATEDLQNLNPGNYSVTVTAVGNCTATANFAVPNNSGAPNLTATATAASCGQNNGGIDLSASPAGTYSYVWSNGALTEDLQNLPSGNYTVTCSSSNGCTATTSVNISNSNSNFSLTSAALPNSSCLAANGSIDITVSPAGAYTFVWSNGKTTEDLQGIAAGSYTVTVTDANGCADIASASVAGPTVPQVAVVGPASVCTGATANLSASAGFSNYLWSNGMAGQNITVAQPNTYSVTATDANGCSAIASQVFGNFPLPTPSISGPASICGGDAQFSVTGGAFSQINWSTGEMSQSITVSQPAIYAVTVTNANGCTATASQALAVGSGLTPDITSTLTDCTNNNNLDAGIGYASYLWSNGSTAQNITVASNGIFMVTVTDANGCTGTASETVNMPPPPQAQVLGASQICEGESTVLAVAGNFVQYLWSTGETTPQISVAQGGAYSVTVSDANGCTASDAWVLTQAQADFTLLQNTACSPLDTGTVTFLLTNQWGCDSVVVISTVLSQPVLAQVQLSACEGESASFNGVSIPAGASQVFVFTAANGCDSTVSVSVVAFPATKFELESKAACQDLPNGSIAVLMLNGEQPCQFSLNGGPYQTDTLFGDLPPGSYHITARDANGCVYPESIAVVGIPPMVVEAADAQMVCGENILLKPLVLSGLAEKWEWSDSSGVVSTTDDLWVDSPGIYQFTVSNVCETISQEIKVEVAPLNQEKLIYLPNSFSPNDDGINDCYRGFIDPSLTVLSYELQIYDRWGEPLFKTTDTEGCWDGWFRGKPMDTFVMVYWVKMLVQNCDGRVVEVFKKGDIHLMR